MRLLESISGARFRPISTNNLSKLFSLSFCQWFFCPLLEIFIHIDIDIMYRIVFYVFLIPDLYYQYGSCKKIPLHIL